MAGGAGVGEPGGASGLGNGPGGGGGRGVAETASLAELTGMGSLAASSSYLAALVGETVMTPSGQANVIYLAVNESSPGTLLLQLCELLATTPLQVTPTPPFVLFQARILSKKYFLRDQTKLSFDPKLLELSNFRLTSMSRSSTVDGI